MFFLTVVLGVLFSLVTVAADNYWDGEAYSQVNEVERFWAQPMLEKIRECHYEEGDVILDIGCRTGELSAEIAQTFPHARVEAIDGNESMIAHAQKKYSHISNLTFRKALVPTYLEKCEPKSYKVIVSFLSLHWLSDILLKQTLHSAQERALRTDGRCYCVLAGKRPDKQKDYLTQAVDAAIKHEPWAKFFKAKSIGSLDDSILSFTEQEFSELSEKEGLGVQEVKVESKEYIFASIEKFKEWLTAVSPYEELLGDKQNEFVHAVRDEYRKICPERLDGTLPYLDYILYAAFKKTS